MQLERVQSNAGTSFLVFSNGYHCYSSYAKLRALTISAVTFVVMRIAELEV